MKAWVQYKFGGPEVLKLEEIEKPTPRADEVLIKVEAVSVNPMDWHIMRASPAFIRLSGIGLFRPKNQVPGADLAGIIEAVGSDVTRFKPGDEVFGEIFQGAFAEYAVTKPEKLALKPSNLSFQHAAGIAVAGLTGLQGMQEHGQVQAGQDILINGASGGVGPFAVQIAKAMGARVTSVCSSANVETARSIGSDAVIDYKTKDFRKELKTYDVMYDAVGNLRIADFKKHLSQKGIGLLVGFGGLRKMMATAIRAQFVSRKNGKRIRAYTAKVRAKDLDYLKELIETGKVRVIIDRTYGFEQLPEAIAYLEEGHARGKIIVSVV